MLPTPDEIRRFYKKAVKSLKKLSHNDKPLAMRALRLVLGTEDRMLTSDELLSALRIDPETEESRIGAEIREERLRYLCPDLLTLDWNTGLGAVWRLTHETCAAFLKAEIPQWHLDAARIHLKLLLETHRDPLPEQWHRSDPIFDPNHPLQITARHRWVQHVQEHQAVAKTPDPVLVGLLKKFLGAPDRSSPQYQRWYKEVDEDDLCRPPSTTFTDTMFNYIAPGTQTLFTMCWFSLFALLRDWWTDPALDLSMRNERGRTLLEIVDENNPESFAIGRELVELGVDVNQRQVGRQGMTTALANAVSMGDAAWVRFLIAHGANVDLGCPLAVAVHAGNFDLARILVQAGAQVDADEDAFGYGSVLALAAASAHLDMVEMLLDAGADAGRRLNRDVVSAVAATGANRGPDAPDIISALVRRGADVNLVGGKNGSALGEACVSQNLPCLRRLIDAGANVNQQLSSWCGGSPLAIVSALGALECVETLIQAGADVNQMLEAGDYRSCLVAAAKNGELPCLQALLAAGADANQTFSTGEYGSALAAAAEKRHLHCMMALLAAGANPNQELSAGKYGNALTAAASVTSDPCVEALLKAGADPNTPPPNFERRLQSALAAAAAAAHWDRMSSLTLLIAAGANVNQLQPPRADHGEGGSALAIAAELGRLSDLKQLISAGADVNLLHKSKELRCGSALVAAAFAGSAECVRALITAGARVDQQTLVGVYGNALTAAAGQGKLECLRILLEAGADVNQQLDEHPGSCGTALIAAAYLGQLHCVTFLMQNGALVDQRVNGRFESALQAAMATVSDEDKKVCDPEAERRVQVYWYMVNGRGPRPPELDERKATISKMFEEQGACVPVEAR
jgi:ankyrin repeat protein